MAKITVLVAIYNAAYFLKKCLDSIIGQTLQDIQIICVDDASTDNSVQIVQKYMEHDKRIRLICQTKNTGQAKARNHALRYATGEYITMVDSDDWLSPDALELAYNVFQTHKKTDIVIFKLIKWKNGNEQLYGSNYNKDYLSGEEAFELSLDWRLHGLYVTHRKMYEKFPYDDSCRLYSDDNTTHIHYLHAQEVRFCNGIYYYRQHEKSSTQAFSVLRFEHVKANMELKKHIKNINISERAQKLLETHRWNVFIGTYQIFIQNKSKLTEDERKYAQEILLTAYYSMDRKKIPFLNRLRAGDCLHGIYNLFRWIQFLKLRQIP